MDKEKYSAKKMYTKNCLYSWCGSIHTFSFLCIIEYSRSLFLHLFGACVGNVRVSNFFRHKPLHANRISIASKLSHFDDCHHSMPSQKKRGGEILLNKIPKRLPRFYRVCFSHFSPLLPLQCTFPSIPHNLRTKRARTLCVVPKGLIVLHKRGGTSNTVELEQ